MPLVEHSSLPSFAALREAGETVITSEQAAHQDIRELHVGLCNAMPDAALRATEQQFLRLVGEANQIVQVIVHPFSLPGIPRGPEAQAYIDEHYETLEELQRDGLDALVLTGANVERPDLADEPFWEPLGELMAWAHDNVTSTLCSCLATHALVQRFHGVHRRRMLNKQWGVFRHRIVEPSHPLVRATNTRFDAPHSRWNTITPRQLRAAGVRVLAETEDGGFHLGTSPDGLRVVYFQGHPEYDTVSLLKEYDREVRRYLAGELEGSPPHPTGYLTPRATRIVNDHLEEAVAARARGEEPPPLPQEQVLTHLDNTWVDTARSMFSNWLGLVYRFTHLTRGRPLMDGVDPDDPLGLGPPQPPRQTPTRPTPPTRPTTRSTSMHDETLAIHAGYETEPTTKSVAVPIYQTVAYEFHDAQHGADLFNLEVPGNIYTRIMNPTQAVLEERLAALEGGVAALVTSAGSAAINYTLLTLARAGKNIVTVPQLYGGTYTLLRHMLPDQGIEGRFADGDSPEDLEKLIDDDTAAVFLESLGNPAGNIPDIAAIAEMAHAHGVPVVVDNTVPTPVLCKPIEHGADIVVHSLTKYIGGHGTTLGGVIVDSGNFDWVEHADRFPQFSEPEPAYHGVVYTEAMGPAAFVARARTVALRNTGAAISPMNAWQILQGIQTLSLRMERHVDNAQAVAEHLQDHDLVEWVEYAGLPSSPYHELAQRYTGGRPSALLSFGITGGFEAGERFYNALELFTRLVNIGDTKSLAAHPASTTHRQLSEEELETAGVPSDMIRLCVGIEHIDDILADLDQALAASQG